MTFRQLVRRIRLVVAISVVMVALAGCQQIGNYFNPQIKGKTAYNEIVNQLKQQQDASTATVDLTKIPGRWNQVMLVCIGVSQEAEDTALGFTWRGPTTDTAGDGYLVFANDYKVLSFYLGGSDQGAGIVDHSVFTLCPQEPGFELTNPIILRRNEASITFQKVQSPVEQWPDYWEVSADEISSLEVKGNLG